MAATDRAPPRRTPRPTAASPTGAPRRPWRRARSAVRDRSACRLPRATWRSSAVAVTKSARGPTSALRQPPASRRPARRKRRYGPARQPAGLYRGHHWRHGRHGLGLAGEHVPGPFRPLPGARVVLALVPPGFGRRPQRRIIRRRVQLQQPFGRGFDERIEERCAALRSLNGVGCTGGNRQSP